MEDSTVPIILFSILLLILRLGTLCGKRRCKSFAFLLRNTLTLAAFIIYTGALFYVVFEMADDGRSVFGEILAHIRLYRVDHYLHGALLFIIFLTFWSLHLFEDSVLFNGLSFMVLAVYSVLFSQLYLEKSSSLPPYFTISGAIWTIAVLFYQIDVAYLAKLEVAVAKIVELEGKLMLELKAKSNSSSLKPSAPAVEIV